MKNNLFLKSVYYSLALTLIIFICLFIFHSAINVNLVLAANPETTIAKQLVAAEISMTVASTSMVLLPAIPGLTGGKGNASTSINIVTNNHSGYSVTLGVEEDFPSYPWFNYPAVIPEDWEDSPPNGTAIFGVGLTNGSLSSANNASGYASCSGVESCWSEVSTSTPRTMVTVVSPTSPEGDNFFLKFRAQIPANSDPLIPAGWYQGTGTITAIAI